MPFSATRDLWLVLKAQNMASRAMSSFSRDIRMVGDSVRLANLQAARASLVNKMAIDRLSGASAADLLVTQNRIKAIDQEIGAMRIAKSAMEEQRVSAQRLSSALSGAAGAMGALGVASTAIGIVGLVGLKSLVNSAVDYEKQSALTRTQVDKFATSLKDIEDIGIRIARSIGVPFEQIQPALYDIFSSMEVGAKDAEVLLRAFSKGAVAGQVEIQSVSRATIGIMNAFQRPISDVNHLLEVQFQLVQEGIGTYEEWTQRIGLVTPSAVRFGQSIETMAAALAVSTRMGLSAARSGTAVSRAMDAMSNPVAVKNLKAMGIAATDANGNFRPMIDILFDFRKALDKVPGEANKVKKILEVFKGAGGTIEARRFLQNMLIVPGNIELFQKILLEMQGDAGAFEMAYSTMADTTAIKTELMKNQWESLKVALGQHLQPAFNKVIDFFTRLFGWFNNLSPAQQAMIAKLLALGVALSLIAGIFALITAAALGFAAAIAVAGTSILVVMGIIAGVIAGFIAFGAAVYVAYQKSEEFRTIIGHLIKGVQELWQDHIVPAAKEIRKAWEDDVLPPLQRFWDLVQNHIMPIVQQLALRFINDVLPAIREVGGFIKDILIWAFQRVSDIIDNNVIPAFQMIIKYYYQHQEAIQNIIDVLVFLGKWFLKIAAIVIGVVVVAFVGPLVIAFGIVVAAIMAVVNIIVTLIEWFKAAKKWIGDVVQSIKDAFAPAHLKNIGADIIDGLLAGLNIGKDKIINFFKNLGHDAIGMFKSFLGIGSPSREFMKLGEYTMQGYLMGLQRAQPAIEAQITAATGGIMSSAYAGQATGGGNYNQNITINTQEINPRRHAAELGFLLLGRNR